MVLAPLFFICFFIPEWSNSHYIATTIILWILAVIIEISDVVDGWLARKIGKITDFGKLFDPFSDVVCRLTYFTCFIFAGIMPVWIFALVLFRELGIIYVRYFANERGIVLAARRGGKLKSLFYSISTFAGLLTLSAVRASFLPHLYGHFRIATLILFAIAGTLALISLLDYLFHCRKLILA